MIHILDVEYLMLILYKSAFLLFSNKLTEILGHL